MAKGMNRGNREPKKPKTKKHARGTLRQRKLIVNFQFKRSKPRNLRQNLPTEYKLVAPKSIPRHILELKTGFCSDRWQT